MNLFSVIKKRPDAFAKISGIPLYPDLKGVVRFHQTSIGVIVIAQISGLVKDSSVCSQPIFGFHIHEGLSCSGNSSDYLADVLTHYNPKSCPHPYHSGDMPPLFGANGIAFSIFLTDRFSVSEIIDKTVVIHDSFDDFTTQPSGNSGKKIACGVIKRY